MLGIAGGLGLIVGPAGLWWLWERRDPALADPRQSGLDRSFLVLLFLTSLSGMLLLSLRETAAMGLLLALHLGIVMGLFVTLPCGKFVHAIHRLAALLRSALERSRPQAPVGVE
jgi:citrate/tricarballylate utilization protein